MSNELHNTLHGLAGTWLGVPGWAWILVLACLALVVWAARQ